MQITQQRRSISLLLPVASRRVALGDYSRSCVA
jgi:hypothetical protein